MSYSLGPVKPWVKAAADELGPKFGITSVGGYRAEGSRDPEGHPSGLALDFMVSDKARGTALAEYARANARRLGVKYVIWRRRIWSVERNAEGWRLMEDRGSPTQNHYDHVHVSFNRTAPGGGPTVSTPSSTWSTKPTPANPSGGRSSSVSGNVSAQPVGLVSSAAGKVAENVRGVAIIGAALLGGVVLIALGVAATASKGAKSSDLDGAELALNLTPQGRAATAAGLATSTKGTP